MSDYILAITTCLEKDAVRIAKALVEARKCACVNIIRGVRSIYHWKGEIEDEEEAILLMKTEAKMETELQDALLEKHPYETPEFITIGIKSGLSKYLEWISSSISET